jgi:plasmid stability protein
MPSGGKRPGAGRKTGSKIARTLDKEAAREILRELVKAEMGPMTQAQIANAKGIKFLVLRHAKSGKFIRRIEDSKGEITLDPENEIIEVWAKDPSVQAFTDLMNRTIDKPADTLNNEQSGTITHIYKWGGE